MYKRQRLTELMRVTRRKPGVGRFKQGWVDRQCDDRIVWRQGRTWPWLSIASAVLVIVGRDLR